MDPIIHPPFGSEISHLTTEWLTNWMKTKNWLTDDQSVVGFQQERLGEGYGYTTCIYAIKITYSEGTNIEELPKSLILKMNKPGDFYGSNELMKMFYEKEYRFYEFYKTKKASFRMAEYHYGFFNDETSQFILIFEDLRESKGRCGDQIQGASLEHAKETVITLAKFHAEWWNSPYLEEIPWIVKGIPLVEVGKSMFLMSWKPFLAQYYSNNDDTSGRAPISENLLALGEFFSSNIINYNAKVYYSGPRTLVHGDFRPDNMFYWDRSDIKENESMVCPLDFQCLHNGGCAEDLAYFLSGAITEENLKGHEDEIVKLYHSTLLECGITDYTLEDFLDDYKEQVLLSITLPIFMSLEQQMVEKQQNIDTSGRPERMVPLFTTWFDRGRFLVDLRVPNAAEFLKKRWGKFERPEDPCAGMDNEVKGLTHMIKQFFLEFTPGLDVNKFRKEEFVHITQQKEFYPMEIVHALHDTTIKDENGNDVYLRIVIPSCYGEVDFFSSLTFYIPETKFFRGVLDSDLMNYRHMVNEARHPFVIIANSYSDDDQSVKYPHQINQFVCAIRWLSSDDGRKWLDEVCAAKLPKNREDLKFNLCGNVTGAHFAVASVIRCIKENTPLRFHRMALLSGCFNPSCDDETFTKYADNFPGSFQSVWKSMWSFYLPMAVDSALLEPELNPTEMPKEIADQFPKSLVVYTEFDPNKESAIKLAKKLNAEEYFVPGFIPQACTIMLPKGRDTLDVISKFLSS